MGSKPDTATDLARSRHRTRVPEEFAHISFLPLASLRSLTDELGLTADGRAEFAPGSFEDARVSSRSADAVMSVDALQYAPDKTKALAEIARILRPGGRSAFVAFELDADRIAGFPVWQDPVGDYRPLLEQTGFDVLRYEEIPNWQAQVAAGFGAIVDQREDLEAELGEAAAGAIVLEASITLQLQPYRGHVLVLATRS